LLKLFFLHWRTLECLTAGEYFERCVMLECLRAGEYFERCHVQALFHLVSA
jgi:hypothetical protein